MPTTCLLSAASPASSRRDLLRTTTLDAPLAPMELIGNCFFDLDGKRVKRFWKSSLGDAWRGKFSVDVINGNSATELRLGPKILRSEVSVGSRAYS